jgi:hypothetical protein
MPILRRLTWIALLFIAVSFVAARYAERRTADLECTLQGCIRDDRDSCPRRYRSSGQALRSE